jgi:hypothetical protein
VVFFPSGFGYDTNEVENFIERIAIDLDAGLALRVPQAEFTQRAYDCYDLDAVDWYLESLRSGDDGPVASPDPWCEPVALYAHWPMSESTPTSLREVRNYLGQVCEEAWQRFDELPAIRLTWAPSGPNTRELRSTDDRLLVTVRKKRLPLSYRSDPHHFRSLESENLLYSVKNMPKQEVETSDLLSPDGRTILQLLGLNYTRRAAAAIQIPDGPTIRFPVRGTRRSNAVMAAVDDAGSCLARFRTPMGMSLTERNIEVVVRPGIELSDQVVLLLAWSSPLLHTYFDSFTVLPDSNH